MIDVEELKPGLVLFRRTDVKHRNWYCRVKVPGLDRYKTKSLKTAEKAEARARALEEDADLRFRIKHHVPVFNRSFSQIAAEFVAFHTFRAIMGYAASKKYIPESQVFKGRLPLDRVAREEFTPEEYRALHTFARGWIKKAKTPQGTWYRTMVYNFVLVMTNTGMRPSEARNLRWRDVVDRSDKQGRRFVVLSVRGKGKFRSLVATTNVSEYLERIKGISRASGPDDPVFSTIDGKTSVTLYLGMIERLLTESKLLLSSSGRRRSTYCFRHTYATFRLSEGVDSLFLAHQMGTSVQMIQNHYGHITPAKNAERILQGMPGWVSAETASELGAGVNT